MSDLPVLEPGVILIHAVSKALLPRLEWALNGLAHKPKSVRWVNLPGYLLQTLNNTSSQSEMLACEMTFAAECESAATLASALASLQAIWFEVSVPSTLQSLGQRYCYTPILGMFHSQTDQAGNQIFSENALLATMRASDSFNNQDLMVRLSTLLGTEWDAQLEPLRKAALEARYATELAS